MQVLNALNDEKGGHPVVIDKIAEQFINDVECGSQGSDTNMENYDFADDYEFENDVKQIPVKK